MAVYKQCIDFWWLEIEVDAQCLESKIIFLISYVSIVMWILSFYNKSSANAQTVVYLFTLAIRKKHL